MFWYSRQPSRERKTHVAHLSRRNVCYCKPAAKEAASLPNSFGEKNMKEFWG